MAVERMNGGAQSEAKYAKRFGHPIEFDAPFTYDAVYIVVDAMNCKDGKKTLLDVVKMQEHKGPIKHRFIGPFL